jgi:uncharacterized protein (TIGR02246 family)
MPARNPEEIQELLAAAFNAGDLDAFLELHEEDATTTVPPDGRRVTGRAAIRSAVEPTFALRPTIRNEVLDKLQGDGLALIHARWSLTGTDQGQSVQMSGRGTIVSRRQPDGSWRIALENTMSPG